MVGKIIILNGTSSSGKTTLARELQSQYSAAYLLCSLDAFWDMTPYKIPAGSNNFPKMKLAMAKSVRALAETGHNVIVDIVFYGQKTYQEFSNILADFSVSFIKVDCPLYELEERELARGDRPHGLAQSQIKSTHDGVAYDLIIDTAANSPRQCAEIIIKHLA